MNTLKTFYARVMKAADQQPLVVSIDIFDTLLLRDTSSEKERYYSIARAMQKLMTNAPFATARDIYYLRTLMKDLFWRMNTPYVTESESRLESLFMGLSRFLTNSLDIQLVEKLVDLELEYEKNHLQINKSLVDVLTKLKEHRNIKLVFCSDMYLSEKQIAVLLEKFNILHIFQQGFVSSDCNATKRSGRLFTCMMETLEVGGESVHHIGDNRVSDYLVPISLGIHAYDLRRRFTWQAMQKGRMIVFSLFLELVQFVQSISTKMNSTDIANSTNTYRSHLESQKYRFGFSFLGPVLVDFCVRLHSALCLESSSFAVRFASRGGIRLMELYRLYCRRHHLTYPDDIDIVYLSRISAAKGCIYKDFEYVTTRLLIDFGGRPISELIRALVPDAKAPIPDLPADLSTFTEIYTSDTELGRELQEKLKTQHELLGIYLKQQGFFEKKIFLVDVGWHGSAQSFIVRAFDGMDVFGLYFGKWDWIQKRKVEQNKILGLAIDDETYPDQHPRCSILNYHHLIEGPLEFPIESTQYYLWDEGSKIVIPNHSLVEEVNNINGDSESIYIGIKDYFSDVENPPSKALSSVEGYYSALAKKIYFPTFEESRILDVGKRSGDMGMDWQSFTVPQFDGKISISKLKVVLKQALWRQGFIARNFGLLRLPALVCFNLRTKGTRSI